MTNKESSLIQKVLDNQEELSQKVDEIDENIHSIYRAVYGDEQNNVRGLLDRQDDDERVHEQLQNDIRPVVQVHNFITSGKLWAVITGVGTIIGVLIAYDIISI